MAKKSSKSSAKLAMTIAISIGGAALLAAFAGSLVVLLNLQGAIPESASEALQKGKLAALAVPFVIGIVGGIVGWMIGGKISSRLTDIALAVSKLGRGSEVKVPSMGDDEIGALGRSLQYLANDLTELQKQGDKKGSSLATQDPQVRQLRDKSLPQSLPEIAGHEIDGALASGSRGGLDYYGAAMVEDALVAYLISGEGQSAVSVVAARMARDEIQRALAQGAAPRKALSHANRVMQQNLPAGVCAKATLLQVSQSGAKLYQAGARSPLLVCQRGELREVAAEGLALGLDDGPVFEKSLRPQEIAMTAGMRLLLVNEAALRTQAFRERVLEHTARHTAMFMNMVLGGIEEDAGSDGLREDVVVLTCKRNA
jgi:hypothetical protein